MSPCLLVSLQAADAQGPVFLLQTASGVAASGTLAELGEQWRVRLDGEKPVRTDADDLVELRRAGRALPALPGGEQVLFVNGDRVPGKVVRMVGERVLFRPQLGERAEIKDVSLPLPALAILWLTSPVGADVPDALRAEKRGRDVVLLRNGDVVEGVLTALDEKTVQVEVEKKVIDLPRERVAAVALNTELASSLRPKGPYARLVLANGARLSLAAASCDGRTLSGTTLFQAPMRVPLDDVVALYVYQGKAVYLSELKPKQYEFTPFLADGIRWPFVADGNVAGRELRVAGGTHDRGIGMHSASRLTYDLSGGYQRFEALVGLDERTGAKGSVRVRVLVDGKPADLGPERELTARDGPLPVRVAVKGAKELTLVVEFGRGGDVQDHVNWVDARLLR